MTTNNSFYTIHSLSDYLDDEENLIEFFKTFKCKNNDVEDFLKDKAIKKEKIGSSRTYLFLDKKLLDMGILKIYAFISITMNSLKIKNLTFSKRKKLFGQSIDGLKAIEYVPSYLIGQLGRCDSCSSQYLSGKTILNDTFLILRDIHKLIGGDNIVVECEDNENLCKFYESNGFTKIEIDSVKKKPYEYSNDENSDIKLYEPLTGFPKNRVFQIQISFAPKLLTYIARLSKLKFESEN